MWHHPPFVNKHKRTSCHLMSLKHCFAAIPVVSHIQTQSDKDGDDDVETQVKNASFDLAKEETKPPRSSR